MFEKDTMAESEGKSNSDSKTTAEATPTSQPEKIKDCIVVAEDSKPNRDIIVTNLKKMGFDVLVFENGKKAWEELSKTNKPVVAIFSDIMMPEMDGLELLKLVRSSDRFKTLPFVFVTAVMQRELILEAKKMGTNGYLLKPITSSNLLAKLRELFPDKKLVLS